MASDVLKTYEDTLALRAYTSDAAQRAAVTRLHLLAQSWVPFVQSRRQSLRRLFAKPVPPRGVWMWGGVGRGKSFLMDCLYSSLPADAPKLRIHFHEFMRSVHKELDVLKGQKNPLQVLAGKLLKQYSLICFDEFHVSDIADAMILERLLLPLFEGGMVFVMTSNYTPDALYPDGLHRDRILPAIALLKDRLDVMNVDAGIDYRRTTLANVRAYLQPNDALANRQLAEIFAALAESGEEQAQLMIENRMVPCVRKAGGIIWFDFETLCNGPRSQNDYLEIASQFHTVLLADVPQMGAGMASAARRFTWLVDVLYDQKVKFIMSAQVVENELYTVGAMAQEFQRTASRLVEMRSAEYLEAPRRGVASFSALQSAVS
jgi:cell division protein ZapE